MPPDTRQPTGIAELMCQSAALLLLLRADYADLVAQLAAFFGEGMNMQA